MLTDNPNTLPPFWCLMERGGYDTDEEDAIREAVNASKVPAPSQHEDGTDG